MSAAIKTEHGPWMLQAGAEQPVNRHGRPGKRFFKRAAERCPWSLEGAFKRGGLGAGRIAAMP